jgi:hypothetical protein
VIKHLRPGAEHPLKRIPVTGEIRNKYFDSNPRTFFSDGLDCPDNMIRPTIRKIVSGYHGHDAEVQRHLRNRLGRVKRFIGIRRMNI